MVVDGRVSAVIPYFNSDHTIASALSSLLGGSRPPDEIVVVNDGSESESSDALHDVIKNIGDEKIRIVTLESNCGGGFARNVGIQAASFNNLFMLDSDNLVGEDLLKRLMEAKDRMPESHVFGPERFLFFLDDGLYRISRYWAISEKRLTL